ncbi:MAG: hypothetical protein IMY80_07570 [Chloroflexi bacterium]|nr:hypothetical protein [Chloroflexota bacterium]
MTFFDWIDFFMNPFNILMFGFTGGILALFITAGAMYVLHANRRTGNRVIFIVTTLTVLLIQLAFWGLVIWYNTPMGPPLELRQ